MTDVAFETPRLVAHLAYAPSEAAEALTLYGDPEVVRYIGGQLVADVAAMAGRIEVMREKYGRYGGRCGAYPVREKATGRLVGTALLKFLPTREASGRQVDTDDLEVGWHLARAAWGKGYATELGRALLARGFALHETCVLHAVVEPPNQRSQAVARRIGMAHQGQTDRYYGITLEHFVSRRP